MTLGSRTATGSLSALRHAFAIAQVAVAVLLLCGAGLLLRTLLTLQSVDPGHRASELLTMMIGTGISNDPEFMTRYYEAVTQEVESVPGVREVALGSALPLRGFWYGQTFEIEGDPPRPQANRDGSGCHIVSPSYFRVLGIPILAGRVFADDDRSGRPEVCIVDEAFVGRYLKGRTPVGTRLFVNAMVQPPRAVLREIVGVVGHVKERPDEVESPPHVYVPIAQNPWWQASLLVQPSSGPAVALAPPIRAAVLRVDTDRPATAVRTLADVSVEATARPRFRAMFVTAFALLALVLAMTGVFGVLAYLVQLRSREFGVRIALGASTGVVLRLVVSSAIGVIGIGLGVGLGAAVALGRSIATFLFGVEPLDVVTFALVPLLLLITATIAVAAPAWRATRVDPVEAFRAE